MRSRVSPASSSSTAHLLLMGCIIATVAMIAAHPVDHDRARRGQQPVTTRTTAAAVRLSKLPLRFEQNVGQHDERVRFVARHPAATLVATDAGLTLAMRSGPVLEMTVPGARAAAPVGRAELVTRTHYLRGNDPARWRTDIRNYGVIAYEAVRDGIDLVAHGEDGQLEYDFVVAPGADPRAAMLDIRGADGLSVTEQGDLVIHTERGDVVQRSPRVFQHGADGSTIDVPAAYRIIGARRIGFEIAAAYDPSRELVIDPVLAYATYLGATSFDSVDAIAVDTTGAAYVAGRTSAPAFPTTANAYDRTIGGISDGFIAKLTPTGDALAFSTYIGGSEADAVRDIAIGADGSVLATGYTASADFPVVGGVQSATAGGQDAFVVKLAPSGSLLAYSTYLGGAQSDSGAAIAVDANGSVYVAGETQSPAFPILRGAQTTLAAPPDIFVAKLNTTGSALVYSTYLGGNGADRAKGIAVDASGSAYVAGHTLSTNIPFASNTYSGGDGDAFVTKLSPNGNVIVYSRYVGGNQLDDPSGIAVDTSGNAYIAGSTTSTNFPVAPAVGALQSTLRGPRDAFVSKLAPAGDHVVYSTYLGGSDFEEGGRIAVDGRGNAHVVGSARSTDFPIRNAVQTEHEGAGDAWVVRLAASGTALVSSTFLGGAGDDYGLAIAVDDRGDAYVGGATISKDLPLVQPFQDANPGIVDVSGFVAKIATTPLAITPDNATVAPGATLTFAASAGSGPGYRFALKVNRSGGSIDPSGVYVAGPTAGTDEVVVIDEAGDEATAVVGVGIDAGPPLPAGDAGPSSPSVGAGPEPAPRAAADTGCGCRAAGPPRRPSSLLVMVLAAGILMTRRRQAGRDGERT